MKKLLFSLAAIATLVGCDEKTDDPIVYDITLEPAAVTLFAGDTHTLKAEITPATNMSLIWTSSDDSIAKVADGVIVAIAAGNATVTAALNCADGYFESTCEVSVIDVPTVTLDIMSAVIGTGDTKTVTATVVPALGGGISLDWKSSDTSVAKVSDGVITAVAAGNATVTASVTIEGRTFGESCAVTVQNPVITFDKTTASLATGKMMTIETTVTPATERALVWESSDTSVATVADGVITGVAEGTATITAKLTAGDKTFEGKCELTVKQGYEIGQIIDFDGVKGIVFWLTDGDTAGKAVSLDESGYITWAISPYHAINLYAQSEDDGEANTEKIKESEPSFAHYPAAKWCVDHGKGWYMPAINEGIEWIKIKDTLNPIISKNGGNTMGGTGTYYWTSTESENGEGMIVMVFHYSTTGSFSDPEGGWKDEDREDYLNVVRAVHKF